MRMQISIGSSGVVFLVAMMISLTSSLGWSVPPATPHYSSGVFFMFFIWPLICMAVFACLQLYVLVRLYWSWRTAGTAERAGGRARGRARERAGGRARVRARERGIEGSGHAPDGPA